MVMASEKILVVVADAGEAEGLRVILHGGGYAADVVGGADEAMSYLASRVDCRLVISDDMLPQTSGLVLLARITREHPGVSVLLRSESEDMAMVRQAFRLGASDLLPKNLSASNLWMAVARALEQSRTARKTLKYQQHLEELAARRATQLRMLRTDLEVSCEVTIETMGQLLDLRDEETEGHSRRVTAYTSELAKAIGLRPAELKTAVRGAFLHDIGKIAVPDAILLKPAQLTDEEMEIMRLHCEQGYSIVRKIPSLAEAAEIVYTHQEKFDGSGYPRGLRGEEIPLGARIFAIADTLDAMTSDRPYRKASSFDYAITEIERCGGRQFDPEIVKAFLALPRETWARLRAEVGSKSKALEMVRVGVA
jgi:putative nucleotidyltransferase with HDIG domain